MRCRHRGSESSKPRACLALQPWARGDSNRFGQIARIECERDGRWTRSRIRVVPSFEAPRRRPSTPPFDELQRARIPLSMTRRERHAGNKAFGDRTPALRSGHDSRRRPSGWVSSPLVRSPVETRGSRLDVADPSIIVRGRKRSNPSSPRAARAMNSISRAATARIDSATTFLRPQHLAATSGGNMRDKAKACLFSGIIGNRSRD